MTQELIRCVIRRKYVHRTPEEEVRQRVLQYMISTMSYPAGRITVEQTVKFNGMKKRADVILYDSDTKPWMVVECKRKGLPLNERTVAQIAMYNRQLEAPFLWVSNGEENHILHVDSQANSIKRLANMPTYPQL